MRKLVSREFYYIVRGFKRTMVWLVERRYYVFGFWILGWIVPTSLKSLDKIPSSSEEPRAIEGTLRFLRLAKLRLNEVVPIWSWDFNRQWVELEIFMPLGLAVATLLVVLLIIQCLREAMPEKARHLERTRHRWN